MRDPFVAVEAATDLRAHARALRRSWATARGGRAEESVRPVIRQSWQRTEQAGIDPDHPRPRRAFASDALEDYRDASGLRDCVDVLRKCLGGFAQDAEHVMVVVDASCRIVWMEGDPRTRRNADRIAFEEGMDWTEASVGTNAIGTALAIDHAVQVFSAEHFSAKQHPWWCSAAPIHDPATGEVLGVVDLSGPMHTAHPHSLALVNAAAGMAEELLRSRRALADERLRRAYLEQTVADPRTALGLVSGDGRLLQADDERLADGAPAVPEAGGPVELPGGGVALFERVDGNAGYVLWDAERAGAAAPARLRLELLGAVPRIRVGGAAHQQLKPRHADILCALALHPDGLTGDQLTAMVYGPGGKPVTTRAELSRLRRVLGDSLATHPYRLAAAVSADVLEVRRALRGREVLAALRAYRAPLLPASTAPEVRRVRAELEGALRRSGVGGGLDDLWAWLESASGQDDEDALARYVRRSARDEPRRAVAAARLRALQSA